MSDYDEDYYSIPNIQERMGRDADRHMIEQSKSSSSSQSTGCLWFFALGIGVITTALAGTITLIC